MPPDGVDINLHHTGADRLALAASPRADSDYVCALMKY